MAAPIIKIKRSSVPGKIPTTASLPLGELALNTNDGKVYIQQDSVGIGSTVIVVNPWSVGLGSNTYNTFFTVGSVGIGTTTPTSSLHVVGDVRVTGVVTATTFIGALTGTATSTTNIPNLTGAITSVNTTTSLGSFTSSQLATALTDETGSGSAVFANSPTLVTPVLGSATATSIVVSSGSTFTNGPILVGTGTSTGTASQPLQVTGGAYVSGNLGIGTTNPGNNNSVNLDVFRSNANIFARNTLTTGAAQVVAADADYFSTPSYSATYISKNGTAATGNIFSSIPNASLGFLAFQNTTNALIYTNGGCPLIFGTLSTEAMRISISQNLGIGTTTPTSKLHVVGDVKVTGIVTASSFVGNVSIAISTSQPSSPAAGTLWYNSNLGRTFIYYNDGDSSQWVDAAPFNVGIIDTLSISGNGYVLGNLGIGTTNPTSKLHVVGDVKVTGVVTATTFVGAFTGTATSTTNIPNLTGAITSVNTTTSLGSFTSAQLATALTDETGSGANVFATSPTLVTPVLGAATATSIVVSSGSTFTNGPILVGTATSTGTASQRLQVTGGAYVSGNLGVGTNNPTVALQLSPNASISNVGSGITLAGTVGSALTVAQFLHVNTNTSYLRIKATRNAIGSDWTTASTKLLTVTDVTEQGYIEYNPNGSTYGMAFGSGATEWARFLQFGNLGIGTTNPTSKLTVVGGVRVTGIVTASSFVGSGTNLTGIVTSIIAGTNVTVSGSTGQVTINSTASGGSGLSISTSTSSTPQFITFVSSASTTSIGITASNLTFIPSSGSLGIGTTNPTSKLTVVGDVRVSGVVTATDFNSTSDISLKDNIQTIINPLDKIIKLNGVTFNWKENQKPSIGVIAQELQEILPELVTQGDIKSVNYNGLIGVLIEAVKEQQKQIEELRAIVKNQ